MFSEHARKPCKCIQILALIIIIVVEAITEVSEGSKRKGEKVQSRIKWSSIKGCFVKYIL